MTSRAAVVLVADDDRSLRSLISAALQRQGHSVLLAASADEAIRISTSPETSFDVLLTDLSMPGGSGISLATEIRAQRPDIAVVLMSGWQVEEPVAGIPGGEVEVLQKPFELSVLAAAVERAVARRV
jgi:two-component system nitrogen regulation response regulator GlnG